jgi:uncharacterized protein (DUF1684 family)
MLALAALAGCKRDGDAPESTGSIALHDDSAAWREQRDAELRKPDGWTSLIGLHWLEPGAHFIGSSADSGIRFAMGPAHMGMMDLQKDGRVFFTPEKGATLTVDGKPLADRIEVKNDHDDTPTVIGFDAGKGVLTLIKRGGRLALRVKHADAPGRVNFKGLDYWPFDSSWRIEGRYVANPPGKTLPILDMIGNTNDMPNPGAVEFQRDGKTQRIEALEDGDQLFFVFADRTSGHGSYPAGRFLYTPKPDADGNVVLDFNRAENPPCAFSPYATCPLAPPENRMGDLTIKAGERVYVPPAEVKLPE